MYVHARKKTATLIYVANGVDQLINAFSFFYRTEASDCLSIRTPAGMIADSCSGMPPLQLLFVNELSIMMILTAVLLTQHLPEWPVKPPGSNPGSADTEPIPAPHPARYTPAASTHA